MKKNRHEKIVDLIRENIVETQTDLVNLLNKDGFNVTQATVSRDIKKLNLIKAKDGNRYKYVMMEKIDDLLKRDIKTLKHAFKSMDMAKNILVIKTFTGMANGFCASFDALKFEENIGSIAGDDVIFIVTKDEDSCLLLYNKIKVLLEKG